MSFTDSSKKSDPANPKDGSSSESEKPSNEKQPTKTRGQNKKLDRSSKPKTPLPQKMDEEDLGICIQITEKLSNSVYAFGFRSPPDPTDEDGQSYLSATESPMDFQTLLNKLNTEGYRTVNEWKNDMNLIFDNAFNYFAPKTMRYDSAIKLKDKFTDLCQMFTKSEEERWMIKIEKLCNKYISADNEQ
ncbi:Bromodomain containing protein [Tritrichomonas foetus]|uniref:Bromodomain containing protein n=1 Tax=Tritrichomonas foetus TaxID=1144522 RepID=A0A1J4JNJ9_9EUKA|nr:Bromodomain containing protein [Tritrichomonas foetus]|eukprot:OHT00697.1 Bromodomain containing protein [Tritrichomonas foetus]